MVYVKDFHLCLFHPDPTSWLLDVLALPVAMIISVTAGWYKKYKDYVQSIDIDTDIDKASFLLFELCRSRELAVTEKKSHLLFNAWERKTETETETKTEAKTETETKTEWSKIHLLPAQIQPNDTRADCCYF